MLITQEEWNNITEYLSAEIKEYCAKKSIDKEEFSKKLGISSRVLTRFYSKKIQSTEKRNNRLLSSLEFFRTLADGLEVNVINLFTQLNIFSQKSNLNNKNEDYLNKFNLISNFIDTKIMDLYRNNSSLYEKIKIIDIFLNIGLILGLLKKSTIKIILNIMEKEDFENLSQEEKEFIVKRIINIGKLL